MIQPKRLTTALVAALVISASCTFLLSRRMDKQSAAKRLDKVFYVTTTRSVLSGELLKPADLQLVAWPASNPIVGAVTKVDEAVNRSALYPLEPGQPVTNKELTAPGAGTGLASKIPDGMRAIALKSDEVVGVAGFLNPGSHVDVLVTYRAEHQEPVTATVLQNAEVIAAGQRLEPDPAGKTAPTAATVVTLLLTPPEAERALLASNQGSIHFVLRNSADKTKTDNTSVSLSQLSTGTYTTTPVSNAPAPPMDAKAEPRRTAVKPSSLSVAKTMQVETILGGQTTAAPGAERTQQ